MVVRILSDTNIESGVSEVQSDLEDHGLRKYFADKCYGPEVVWICIILMCRDSRHEFKQRKRYIKKEQVLSFDLMFDSPTMEHSTVQKRRQIIAEKLYYEAPAIVTKYKFKEFDTPRFIQDWREWVLSLNWMDPPE